MAHQRMFRKPGNGGMNTERMGSVTVPVQPVPQWSLSTHGTAPLNALCIRDAHTQKF